MLHRFAVTGFAVALALSAQAEVVMPPDLWLSESLDPASIAPSTKQPSLGGARGLATEVIRVSPLDDVKLDAVGVVPAKVAGLPVDFWGDSNPAKLSRLLKIHSSASLPEVTALFHRILLAELNVPVGHHRDGEMLLARLDHLLAAGALDQAEALLARSGIPNATLFRRWFDIGLLTGRAQQACSAMLGDPGLTPALQARVFCLARAGDWAAAALTLATAASLDQISPEEENLLSRFLDPELFEGEPPLPAPKRLTPLVFTMREALALPRSGQSLPLAFLHGDLRNYAGWRNRISAAERLVRAQSVPAHVLLEVYTEARPSASGGVWQRVQAIQNLMAALEAADVQATARALVTAYHALGSVHLEFALAELMLPKIADLELSGEAATVRFHLSLLHKNQIGLSPFFAGDTPQDAFLNAIASGNLADATAQDDLQSAVLAAFRGTSLQSRLLRDAAEGRKGEAVLKSFELLHRSGHADPVAVETVIAVLLLAGLENEARRIALQLVILKRRASI